MPGCKTVYYSYYVILIIVSVVAQDFNTALFHGIIQSSNLTFLSNRMYINALYKMRILYQLTTIAAMARLSKI